MRRIRGSVYQPPDLDGAGVISVGVHLVFPGRAQVMFAFGAEHPIGPFFMFLSILGILPRSTWSASHFGLGSLTGQTFGAWIHGLATVGCMDLWVCDGSPSHARLGQSRRMLGILVSRDMARLFLPWIDSERRAAEFPPNRSVLCNMDRGNLSSRRTDFQTMLVMSPGCMNGALCV